MAMSPGWCTCGVRAGILLPRRRVLIQGHGAGMEMTTSGERDGYSEMADGKE